MKLAPLFEPRQDALELPGPPSFNGVWRTDLRARAAYSEGAGIYRIVPAAVAVPSTTTALRELVIWAGDHRLPLVPRGAGSGMPGGNVGSGVVLDLTVLDGCPLTLHPSSRRAYAGAGVTLRALQAEAARAGLRFPPDPSSARFATLGGMVSTNAAGPTSLRRGSVRRWIEAVDLITADGEPLTLRRGITARSCPAVDRFAAEVEPRLCASGDLIRTRFPRTGKNSSGYALDAWLESGDLLDLLIGAEGTLGVITGVECRLEPIPPRYGALRAGLRTLDSLGEIVPLLQKLEPSTLEYLDATLLRLIEPTTWEGALLVEFEADEHEPLEDRVQTAAAILGPASADLQMARSKRDGERLWEIRHAASPLLAAQGEEKRSIQVIEDACVPVEAVGEYIAAVRTAGARHGLELVIFGHLGSGNVHVNLQPDVTRTGWEGRVEAIFRDVSASVAGWGGTLSGEHGDGRLRAPLLESIYGAPILELFRAVKRGFDPAGILNPGVKLPAQAGGELGPLKIGSRAPAIPEDIEEGLREIERSAGYSRSRLELA